MDWRFATADDCLQLAEMNWQLIRDENHRNRMTVAELEMRMRGFLEGEYKAVLFTEGGRDVAYALYCPTADGVYLRQFFVDRDLRSKGLGRTAMRILMQEILPPDIRVTLEVLTGNKRGRAFWESVGFVDYCTTMEQFNTRPPAQAIRTLETGEQL